MEREVAGWVFAGWWRRPWACVIALGLAALPWGLGLGDHVGVSSQVYSPQLFMSEAAFLLALLGALVGLQLLETLEPTLEPLGRGRAWRVRASTLGMSLLVPLPLILVPAWFLPGDSGSWMIAFLPRCAWLLAAACCIDALRTPAPRSIWFLALAWWLPALVSLAGPSSSLSNSNLFATSAAGSTAQDVGFAPILALALAAVAFDLLRRRSA